MAVRAILYCMFTVGAVSLAYLLLSPYTKVEESFNIQAVHDILKYGIPSLGDPLPVLSQYDHVTFPGSVPRTFVGAILLAGVSRPLVWLLRANPQVIVRGILWLFNCAAFAFLSRCIQRKFGESAMIWYLVLQSSQFHVMYYASRTLPNIFALPVTTLAFAFYIKGLLPVPGERATSCHRLCLYLLTLVGIVFRSEIAVLLATTTLYLWARGSIGLRHEIIPAGSGGLLIGLTITVLIDSFFWQRFPLWPELAGFAYNVLEGKASNWGTDPWYHYFLNALPRLLFNPLALFVCIPFACLLHPSRQVVRSIVIPSIAFIGIMSFQPHKEWRFILYTIPQFTTVAAVGASYIWTRRAKSTVYRFVSVSLILSVLLSLAISFFMLLPISISNYPGGVAMKIVHDYAHGSQQLITVHMDTLTCQTGATHFLEMPLPTPSLNDMLGSPNRGVSEPSREDTQWIYDKTESNLKKQSRDFWDTIDYALVEDELILRGMGEWKLVDSAYGYSGIHIVRPGVNDCYACGVETGVLQVLSGDNGIKHWEGVKSYIRKHLTRGWWVEARLSPKVRVMKQIR